MRLTRLAVVDTIAEPAREWLILAVPGRAVEWVDGLISCPHCLGVWIAAAVIGSYVLVGHTLTWQLTAATFTLAWITGHLVQRADL